VIQEVHRIAASGHVRLFPLSKATDFTRGSCKPEFTVLAQFELGILHGSAGAGINNGVGGPKGMGRQGGMGDGLWCRVWMRRWGFGKHGIDVIDSVRGNLVPWRFFGLLGFDTERVVGREVVDSFFLFCLDACLVAARWALCRWRRRWPALLVRAW
jgi:hypothetical protein